MRRIHDLLNRGRGGDPPPPPAAAMAAEGRLEGKGRLRLEVAENNGGGKERRLFCSVGKY